MHLCAVILQKYATVEGCFSMGKNLLFVFYILEFALKSVFFSLKYSFFGQNRLTLELMMMSCTYSYLMLCPAK